MIEFICSINTGEAVRSPAIRLVTNKLFGHNDFLTSKIEEFACNLLATLSEIQEPAETEEQKNAQEEDVKNRLLLFFALCTKKPALLFKYLCLLFFQPKNYCARLTEVYVSCNAEVKKIIHNQSAGLIRAIGMNSPDFIQLINSFQKGAESLILYFLQVLTEKGKNVFQTLF